MTELFRPRGYFRAATVKEAVSLVTRYGQKAKALAGGTDLLVAKPGDVEYLVDITHLPLSYIESDYATGGINIGALTTVRDIETCKLFEDAKFQTFGILAEAAHKMGYVTTRNVATIGGNICNAVPSADFPPPLIALDGKASIAGPGGKRTVPLADFFVDVRKTVLTRGELLIEIQLPEQQPFTGVAFSKFGRLQQDIALVNVAVRVTLGPKEICKDVRIVLGAVAPTPIRAKRAERTLEGKRIEDAITEKASVVASEETSPIADVRASAEYRREISRVLVKRAIEQAFERARTKWLV